MYFDQVSHLTCYRVKKEDDKTIFLPFSRAEQIKENTMTLLPSCSKLPYYLLGCLHFPPENTLQDCHLCLVHKPAFLWCLCVGCFIIDGAAAISSPDGCPWLYPHTLGLHTFCLYAPWGLSAEYFTTLTPFRSHTLACFLVNKQHPGGSHSASGLRWLLCIFLLWPNIVNTFPFCIYASGFSSTHLLLLTFIRFHNPYSKTFPSVGQSRFYISYCWKRCWLPVCPVIIITLYNVAILYFKTLVETI